jgi:hypothetical protein
MPEIKAAGPNPLQKYFRQPKIYVTLPSKGAWYPEGTIEMTESGELPVYAMTAKDELMFKTPDALLNGQSTVEVVQSCIPAIRDAWYCPAIDMDAILVAIRIATYGEKLEVKGTVPGTTIERAFDLDLRRVLDKFGSVIFETSINVGDMLITIRPQTYREFTNTAIKTFEEQRIASVVNDDEISDEEKLQRFNQSFTKLTALTVDLVVNSIVSIQVDGDVVTDRNHLAQFIANADKEFFTAITDRIENEKKKFELEPIKVQASEEELEAGAPKEYTIPVTFDQASFFA